MQAGPAIVAMVVLSVAAGCLDAPSDDDGSSSAGAARFIVPGFAQTHDHHDPALHEYADGLDLLGFHNLLPEGDGVADAAARGAYVNSEIIVKDDVAYVGWLGAPWALTLADVSNASNPAFLGALELSGAWVMDVTVSDDGDWVFLSIYNGASVGSLFSPDYALGADVIPTGLAGPGVLAVDVRDKTAPRQAGFFPIHGLGPHTAVYHAHQNGNEYVFANKAEGGIPGNGIVILEVVFTPVGQRAFRTVGFFSLDHGNDPNFPHDVDVGVHPVTGQTILYAAYWDAGLVMVDVSDPADPVEIGRGMPDKDEVQFHDVHAFARLVDGRHYTITAPEIPTGEHTGHMRLWDTTDPAEPFVVHRTELPGGYIVEEDFDFSPHNFIFLSDGRVAWAHGHAGLWVTDWFDRAADGTETVHDFEWVGYAVPSVAGAHQPEWSPLVGTPWVWGVGEGDDGTLWAVDIASGVHGYRVPANDQ